MRHAKRLAALVLLASFASAAPAQTQEEEQYEPKFIWGALIQFAISKLSSTVFGAFTRWLDGKTDGKISSTVDSMTPDFLKDSGAKIDARAPEATGPQRSGAGAPPAVVVGDPETPLTVEGGEANYQAVHVALMVARGDGKHFVFRPVNEGFRTGERFKLRVLSTFGGELFLENVNPLGERRQIYPPRAQDVVILVPGRETFLPLGADLFFEFTRATGREQLVIHVADPRAVGAAASRNKVYRQDALYGSNFVQEVSPNTFPVISQSVEIAHLPPGAAAGKTPGL